MTKIKKEGTLTKCAICDHPIEKISIMATNPRTGKMANMNDACWKKR